MLNGDYSICYGVLFFIVAIITFHSNAMNGA
jgi:hypothetical protein